MLEKWNVQLFKEFNNKIKWKFLNNWFSNFFNLKNLIIRLFSFAIIILISSILFFVLRDAALENKLDKPMFNTGMGFSFGNEWDVWTVYFIKSLMMVLFLILSLCFNKWYLYIPLFVVSYNSLLNIIDKAIVDVFDGVSYYHAVVDYFYWSAFDFTNNMADNFIVSFIIVFFICYLYFIYISYKNEKSKIEESENNNENNSK